MYMTSFGCELQSVKCLLFFSFVKQQNNATNLNDMVANNVIK